MNYITIRNITVQYWFIVCGTHIDGTRNKLCAQRVFGCVYAMLLLDCVVLLCREKSYEYKMRCEVRVTNDQVISVPSNTIML